MTDPTVAAATPNPLGQQGSVLTLGSVHIQKYPRTHSNQQMKYASEPLLTVRGL